MAEDSFEIIKVIIIGQSGVGKSSLLLRYTDEKYDDGSYPTIGLDVKMKNITYKDQVYKLQIWDTAGQERFRTIVSQQYKGVKAVLLVYDITQIDSFKRLDEQLQELMTHATLKPVTFLIGNKLDLSEQRQVSEEMARNYSNERDIQFLEISAKLGSGVSDVFERLVEAYQAQETDKRESQNIKLTSAILEPKGQQTQQQKNGCC